MLFISDPSTVPSGGWQFPHPSGGVINSFNLSVFYEKIVTTYQSNNVPAPSWEDVVKYICGNQYVSCREDHVPFINRWTQGNPITRTSSCCGGYSAPLP